jgi:hypothetical protein
MGRTPLAVCALWRVAPSQDMQTTPDPLGSRLCGRHQVTSCYSRTRKASNQSANVSPRKGLVARTLMPLRSTPTLTWHLGATVRCCGPRYDVHPAVMSWRSRPLDGQTGFAHTPHTVWRGFWKRRSVRPLYPGDGVGVGIGAVVIAVVVVVVLSAVSNNSSCRRPRGLFADAPEDSCRRRQNFLSAVDRHSAPESCSRSSRSSRSRSCRARAAQKQFPRLVRRVTARRSWHIMEQHVLAVGHGLGQVSTAIGAMHRGVCVIQAQQTAEGQR